jgi:uncharacterized membrane protein YgaE (UPF0421/DUF939 family)
MDSHYNLVPDQDLINPWIAFRVGAAVSYLVNQLVLHVNPAHDELDQRIRSRLGVPIIQNCSLEGYAQPRPHTPLPKSRKRSHKKDGIYRFFRRVLYVVPSFVTCKEQHCRINIVQCKLSLALF